MKYPHEDRAEALEQLRKHMLRVISSTPRGSKALIYACIKHVARSGMSRRMDFYLVGSDRRLVRVSWELSRILGWPLSDRGLRVDGCGMDMGFHTISCAMAALAGPNAWRDTYAGPFGHNWPNYFHVEYI